jgi:hypothetical protein
VAISLSGKPRHIRVTQRSLAELLLGFKRRSSGLAVMVPSLISE